MTTVATRPSEETAIRACTAAAACAPASKPWVLAMAILGSGIVYTDTTALSVALPVIQTSFAAPLTIMQWIVNAYTLTLAAFMLTGGSAGDRFGRRRVFMFGMCLFALASIWCGLVSGPVELAIARAVQGLGGALLVPANLAIIGAVFPAEERGRAIGTWAAASAVTAALGPVLGGWLVDAIGWRAIFFLNVPLALITLAIAWRHVPESRDPDAAPGLDWIGTGLAACGLTAIAYGLIQSSELGWHHHEVSGTLAAGIILLAGFVVAEARSKAPMVPLGLFRSLSFSGVNLLTLCLYGALIGALFFLPFDLIQARHYMAVEAGAAFLPFTLLIGALSRWSGGLLDRFGARLPLIIGPLIAALGYVLLAIPELGGSYWTDILPGMTVLGLGMAVAIAPLTTTVMNAVSEARMGIASGVNNAVTEIAGLLAVAAFGAIAIAHFNERLDVQISGMMLSADAAAFVDLVRTRLASAAVPATLGHIERELLVPAMEQAYHASFRLLMVCAAALALLSALIAALTIKPTKTEE